MVLILLHLGLRTDDSLHLVANPDDATQMELSVQTVGNTGDNAINALMETTTGLRADVATWARTETGGVMIPLSKLPNLQLGNTYVYIRNCLQKEMQVILDRMLVDLIEWHTGDLAVIAHNPSNCKVRLLLMMVFMYLLVQVELLPRAPVANTDFRVVVSSDNNINTTFTSSGLTGDSRM